MWKFVSLCVRPFVCVFVTLYAETTGRIVRLNYVDWLNEFDLWNNTQANYYSNIFTDGRQSQIIVKDDSRYTGP